MPAWNSVMKCVHWSGIPMQLINYNCLKAQKTQVNPTYTGEGFTITPPPPPSTSEMKTRSTMTTKTSDIS